MINRTRVNYHSSEYEGDYNLANRSTVWIKPPTHSLTCVVCLFVFNEVNNINASIHPGHVSKDKILPLLPCASSSCGSCRIIIIMRTYFRGWLKVFNDADDSGGWPQFMIYRITDFRAQTQESRDLLASGGHWLEHYCARVGDNRANLRVSSSVQLPDVLVAPNQFHIFPTNMDRTESELGTSV